MDWYFLAFPCALENMATEVFRYDVGFSRSPSFQGGGHPRHLEEHWISIQGHPGFQGCFVFPGIDFRFLRTFCTQRTSQKPMKNHARTIEKSTPKTMLFSTSIFSHFGTRFWRGWHLKLDPSWPKKPWDKRSRPVGKPIGDGGKVWAEFGKGLGSILGGFGTVLGTFGKGLGRILERFWHHFRGSSYNASLP